MDSITIKLPKLFRKKQPVKTQKELMIDHNREPLRVLVIDDEEKRDMARMLGITEQRVWQMQCEVRDSIARNNRKPVIFAAAEWQPKHANELFMMTWIMIHSGMINGSVRVEQIDPSDM